MSEASDKLDWCLKKAKRELAEKEIHRGLVKKEQDRALAARHIAKAEYHLFKKFEQLTKNKITILISHRFSTVRMANKIIVIDKGKLIEQGSHTELLRKRGHYAELFRMQAEGYQNI